MVTVIVPVYNIEKYLAQCLDSLFNQTHKNIEVILVNDGSTDNSINIINKYKEKNSNLVYLEQDNKGVSEARNLALKHAKGEYVLYIDSDDYIEEDMIESLYNKAIETNSDIVICGHNEIYDDTVKGTDVKVLLDMKDNIIYSGVEVADMMLECKILGTLWNKLFKRELLINHEFYFEPGRYIQDWYPVFKEVSLAKKVSYVNKALYNYRQRGTSTVNKKNEKLLNDYIYAVSQILEYIQISNLKFDKTSVEKFNLITSESIRYRFCILNLDSGIELYNKFNQIYPSIEKISLFEYIKRNDLGKRIKVQSILWNIKMLHLFIKFEYKRRS